jgi:hypothetical protein
MSINRVSSVRSVIWSAVSPDVAYTSGTKIVAGVKASTCSKTGILPFRAEKFGGSGIAMGAD